MDTDAADVIEAPTETYEPEFNGYAEVEDNYYYDCADTLVDDDGDKPEEEADDIHSGEKAKEVSYGTLHLKLLYFYLLFKISDRAMFYLLTILIEEGVAVPRSLYLFKKPNISSKVDILKSNLTSGGKLAYLSIIDNLKYCLSNKLLVLTSKFTDLSIKVGIDGIPIFRSSPVNLWPILFTIDNIAFKRPLPIAVYVGFGKPTC